MKRKLVAMLLMASMSVSVLTACGGSSDAESVSLSSEESISGTADESAPRNDATDSTGNSSGGETGVPETFTSYLSLNIDFEMLKSREAEGVNKTIMTYPDFRKAFSLSVDRTDYVRSCTAASQATYGLLNSLYICDPDTGMAYRDTEYAQQAL